MRWLTYRMCQVGDELLSVNGIRLKGRAEGMIFASGLIMGPPDQKLSLSFLRRSFAPMTGTERRREFAVHLLRIPLEHFHPPSGDIANNAKGGQAGENQSHENSTAPLQYPLNGGGSIGEPLAQGSSNVPRLLLAGQLGGDRQAKGDDAVTNSPAQKIENGGEAWSHVSGQSLSGADFRGKMLGLTVTAGPTQSGVGSGRGGEPSGRPEKGHEYNSEQARKTGFEPSSSSSCSGGLLGCGEIHGNSANGQGSSRRCSSFTGVPTRPDSNPRLNALSTPKAVSVFPSRKQRAKLSLAIDRLGTHQNVIRAENRHIEFEHRASDGLNCIVNQAEE
jgi:hypothetical protein